MLESVCSGLENSYLSLTICLIEHTSVPLNNNNSYWKSDLLTFSDYRHKATISNMQRAFTVQPRYLDDVSLHHLISALCSLSLEAMEMAYGNNKVKIFSS